MNRLNQWLGSLIGQDMVLLAARLALAAIFLMSGRTKVDGWLNVTPEAIDLFATEYKLPVLSPVIAAYVATYAEHVLPLLLIVGLFSRGAALGLLGMSAVIQVFVYPDAWPTHLSWAALALVVIRWGPGAFSVDHWIKLDN
jgi:putative oxidoreductase